MTPRTPAASDLPDPTFSVREALARGLTPGQLRHSSLTTPTRGIRSHGTPRDVVEQVRPLLDVLPPGTALSHDTAARVLGLPLPHRWSPDEPVHVTHTTAQISRPGVIGHRASRDVVVRRGLLVVSGPATWRDLAAHLPLDDLIAAGDAVLHLSLGSLAGLELVTRLPGRGARPARQALALVRPGAESPWETFTRLAAVRAGLPEPELNQWILDDEGLAIGRVDMLWRAARVIAEYEGDHHRASVTQYRRDLARVRRLEAAGYRVVRVTADDLATPAAVTDLVRSIAAGLTRPDAGRGRSA